MAKPRKSHSPMVKPAQASTVTFLFFTKMRLLIKNEKKINNMEIDFGIFFM